MKRFDWYASYANGNPIASGRAAARFVLRLGRLVRSERSHAGLLLVLELEDCDCVVHLVLRPPAAGWW